MSTMSPEHYAQHYGDTLPIAIIGAGCRFPQAASLFEFWRRIADGEELITRFDADALQAAGVDPAWLDHPDYVPAASVVEDAERFDWQFFGYSRQEAESIDPQQRLFLMCAWEALEMAGYQPGKLAERVGVVGSARMSTWLTAQPEDAQNLVSPATFQKLIGNDKDYLATRVAYKLGLRGPAYTVQTACSSSLIATHLACEAIASGDAEMMLAGGASLSFPQQAGYLHREGMIFSRDGHCRPFSAEADGTLVGNGAAVVLLKRLDRALQDGDAIMAVIRGTATNNDGNDKAGFTAPSLSGQRDVIRDALGLADVRASSIGLVEAHGTATPLGDPLEVAALVEAWSPDAPRAGQAAIGSLKSNLGHLDTAAGVASLLKAGLALWQQQIPPSLHFTAPNPAINFAQTPFRVPTHLEPWPQPEGHWRRAAVSSFGIGGSNAHAILEAAPPRPATSGGQSLLPLLLSARSPSALRTLARQHAARLSDREPGFSAADYAATSLYHRTPFPCRLLLLATDADGWLGQLLDIDETAPEAALPPLTLAHDVTLNDAQRQRWLAALTAENPDWAPLFPRPLQRTMMPVAPFEGEICAPHRTGQPEAAARWQAVRDAGHQRAEALAAQLDLSVLAEENACVDALHGHFVSALLADLEPGEPLGDLPPLMARLGIPERYRDLMQRMLRDLASTGYLTTTPAGYTLQARPPVDVEGWLSRMRDVGYHHLAALIARTGPQLGNMLRGSVDPVSVVFPAAATDDVEHMYQEQPWSRYFNQIAASSVRALAERARAPLAILEIGGGTGGTTQDLLKALPAGRCARYTFTDVGPLFLQRARDKFRDYPFMAYQPFDMEQPPAAQGLEPGNYDLIVAANVLHNSADLRQLFRRLSTLLKPEGIIVLREITAPKKLFDFVFGALVPPIADTDQRHGELFASAEDWQAALNEAGFGQFDAFPASGSPASALGEQILVAQWTATAANEVAVSQPALSLSVSATGQDERGQTQWQAAALVAAIQAALPARGTQQLRVEQWHCDPAGAPSPLELHIVPVQDRVMVQVGTTPLLQARWCQTRTGQPDQRALPATLPRPWLAHGGLWHWAWQPATLAESTVTPPDILPVPNIAAGQAAFYQQLRDWLAAGQPGDALLLLAEGLWDMRQPHAAAWLPGFLAVARHEYPALSLTLADGEKPRSEAAASQLAASDAPLLRWHEAGWQCQTLSPLARGLPDSLAGTGCELFIGGLTPTGLAVAGQQVAQGARKLVFLVRRQPRPAEAAQIAVWQAQGVEVVIDTGGDVHDAAAFDAALSRMAQHRPIATLWHLVGTIDDRPIAALAWPALQAVCDLRVASARRVDAHEAQLSPARTLYFSSAASVLGPQGQAAHASACAALERLASERCAAGHDTLAIAWGLWGITSSLSARQSEALAQRGMLALATPAALDLLLQAQAAPWPVVTAMHVDGGRLQRAAESAADRLQFAVLLADAPSLTPQSDSPHSDLDRFLREVLAKQLNCAASEIQAQSNLVQLGLDSLLFLDLNETLGRELGVKLNAESVLKAGTVHELKLAVEEALAPVGQGDSLLRQRLQRLESRQPGWLDARGDVLDRPEGPLRLTPLQRARWQHFPTQPRLLYVEYDKPHDFPLEPFLAGWQQLLARHPLLRSVINDAGDVVTRPTAPPLAVERHDWRGETAAGLQAKQQVLRERLSALRVDLAQLPHLAIAVGDSDRGYRICLSISTLLVDIESFRVLLRELHQLIAQPEAALPALRFSPHAYQQAVLALAEPAEPAPTLPAPSLPWMSGERAARFTIWRDALPAAQWLALKQQGEALGISGTDVLMAAWALTLRDWLREPALHLRLDYTDRLPLHPHASQLVTDASTLAPISLALTPDAHFLHLAEAVGKQRLARLEQTLPGGEEEAGWLAALPVAFTSLLGVRQAYAIPEVSDPLLGMPDYEYAAQPETPLHLQALEEESALLFNIDQQQGWLPEALGEIAMLTLRQLLETLAASEAAWHAPLAQLLPEDAEIRAMAGEDHA